ncbi:TIGR03546 family protein [Parathalassolituus penaei]|uniref:TIGR03546 family protein n=1 Tax=Parathalassolituus penaei TaxID=2997323 RepID=A0A9X3IU97_9GAMM|nr:TIGR03546 family protein [Parathalassolituus penaei]MCY0967145.1 TIGR03546 family protein [Parathalassolituus penaei]
MLSMLANLLKALNSESEPGQISLAFVFGMLVAFTPMWSFHNLLLLLLVLVLRTNISGFLVGLAFFSLVALLVDPLSIRIGEAVLTNPDWREFFTGLYQSEFWRMTAFNNTLTMGGLILGLVCAPVLYVVSNVLIRQYRERVMEQVNKLKIVQVIKASNFYRMYQSLAG